MLIVDLIRIVVFNAMQVAMACIIVLLALTLLQKVTLELLQLIQYMVAMQSMHFSVFLLRTVDIKMAYFSLLS